MCPRGQGRPRGFHLWCIEHHTKIWYFLQMLRRIYTCDFFACDFLRKMDVATLHVFNNGSHCDKSYLTAENYCLKLFLFR